MSDVVVTVPKDRWRDWIAEGDAVDAPETGEEWGFYTGGGFPRIQPGERVYIVAWGRLRGYAPLTRLAGVYTSGREAPVGVGSPVLCRRGGAVAVTIPEDIRGFLGWRSRWWDRSVEIPFPDWRTAGLPGPRPTRTLPLFPGAR